MAQYRGNLDGSLILKSETEATGFTWVRFTKRIIDEKNKTVRENHSTLAYKGDELSKMKKMCLKIGVPFLTGTGWDEMEILHDHTLIKSVEDLEKLIID
ncbi:MAG: hypothetical protein V2B15_04665 [Bacteroidota bacterium]